MGMRFRRSIKLGKHVRINLSKSGIGYSVGTKGYRVSKMANGRTRTTVSIPGTGISHVSETKSKSLPARSSASSASLSSDVPMSSSAPPLFVRVLAGVFIIVIVFLFCMFGHSLVDSDLEYNYSGNNPSISIVPMDDISLSVGDTYTLFFTHGGFVQDLSSVSFHSDNPDLYSLKLASHTDITAKIIITALKEGSGYFFVSCIGIESNSIRITISTAETAETRLEQNDTAPVPQSVYTFILNKSSKIIHRFGCSHAPEAGTPTTLFYEWIDEGYKKCSFCFD